MAYSNLTIGEIISSVLNYDQLNDWLEEDRGCHATSTYAPCDGRTVNETDLNRVLGNDYKVPDLRGRFQRGLNLFHAEGQPPFDIHTADEDGASRNVGDYQADDLKNHKHNYNSHIPHGWTVDYGHQQSLVKNDDFGIAETGDPNGSITGKETKPRNISVYFYIKIN
jgi:hypothetical protein